MFGVLLEREDFVNCEMMVFTEDLFSSVFENNLRMVKESYSNGPAVMGSYTLTYKKGRYV